MEQSRRKSGKKAGFLAVMMVNAILFHPHSGYAGAEAFMSMPPSSAAQPAMTPPAENPESKPASANEKKSPEDKTTSFLTENGGLSKTNESETKMIEKKSEEIQKKEAKENPLPKKEEEKKPTDGKSPSATPEAVYVVGPASSGAYTSFEESDYKDIYLRPEAHGLKWTSGPSGYGAFEGELKDANNIPNSQMLVYNPEKFGFGNYAESIPGAKVLGVYSALEQGENGFFALYLDKLPENAKDSSE